MYTEFDTNMEKELLLTLQDTHNMLIQKKFNSCYTYELLSPKGHLIFKLSENISNGVYNIKFEPEIPGLVLTEPMKSYILTLVSQEFTRRTVSPKKLKTLKKDKKEKAENNLAALKQYLNQFKTATINEKIK